eukprot:5790005-Ditylum_brightwellii.AAC.1
MSRDDRAPQVKLTEDKLMDILKMQYPSLGREKWVDRGLIARLKDRPNSSGSVNAWSCWTHQSKARKADIMSHQQLAIGSKS